MSKKQYAKKYSQTLPFGTICGYAPGGIPAFSSDYDNYTEVESYFSGGIEHYYGSPYQCVEFSRRWMIHALGLTFGSVGMAYEIFDKSHAVRVKDKTKVPWTNIKNGSTVRPRLGSLLIWHSGGEFSYTGHVAVVTDVSDEWVRIAEQNVDDTLWPNGQDWARELDVEYNPSTGEYFIHERWGRRGGRVMGWKNLPEDHTPEPIPHP
jgi:glutathionylspermidine amidase/synthetase